MISSRICSVKTLLITQQQLPHCNNGRKIAEFTAAALPLISEQAAFCSKPSSAGCICPPCTPLCLLQTEKWDQLMLMAAMFVHHRFV